RRIGVVRRRDARAGSRRAPLLDVALVRGRRRGAARHPGPRLLAARAARQRRRRPRLAGVWSRVAGLLRAGGGAGGTRRAPLLPPARRDPELVAATGMPAPGADGLTIQRLSPRWSFLPIGLVLFQAPTSSAFLLGPDGGVSFTADVAGGSCPDPADLRRALFAPDGAGGETLIALEGEPLPGAEGPEALRLWSVGLADDGLGSLLAHVDYVSDSDPGPPPLGSLPRSALLRWRPLDGDLATVAREGVPSAFLAGEPIADLGVPRASPGGAVA